MVFGSVVSGMDVVEQIAAVGSDTGQTSKKVVIAECGQLSRASGSAQASKKAAEPEESVDAEFERTRDLLSTDPAKLNAALKYAEKMHQEGSRDKATEIAKNAFDDAIANLDSVEEETYKDTTLVMQLLRDKLTKWAAQ